MVGDGAPITGRLRGEPPLGDQRRQQLGVMHDLVRSAVVGVLVRERVEAMGAAGDDLRHARAVQGLDVLLRQHLEQVLVAHPASRIAGAPLARPEDREVDAGCRQQPSDALGGPLARVRRKPRRTRPRTGTSGAGSPGCSTRMSSTAADPVGARARRLAPRVLGRLDTAEHRLGLTREPRLGHHEVPTQIDDRVDVLDVDRAFAHARAARHAVPDDLDRRPRSGRAAAARRSAAPPAAISGASFADLVAEIHDQQLRRQRLPGVPRRADLLAPTALRAREEIEHLLAREVGRRPPRRAAGPHPLPRGRSGAARGSREVGSSRDRRSGRP